MLSNINMKKKCIIVFVIVAVFCVSFIIINDCLIKYNKKQSNNQVSSDYDSKDWALHNYGQVINGKKGVAGIDINIKNVHTIVDINNCKDVIVAVVDSGIYPSKVLGKSFYINIKEVENDSIDNDGNGYIDDICGWDFYNNDNIIYDNYLYDYHGTYIANMIKKVTSTVKILPCKFLEGVTGDADDAVKAIKYAIDNGADIINCSWCFENQDTKLYNLIKENPDVLFICAAGNSNIDLDEKKLYPASYALDNVISVMSICNDGSVYEYSGYGMSVDVSAPGKDICVVVPEEDQTYIDGTSISVAYVTAAAAMLKSYNPNITPVDIKNILISTSHKLDTLKNKCKSEGCIDIYSAIGKCIELKEK